jgi:hypothetical protein
LLTPKIGKIYIEKSQVKEVKKYEEIPVIKNGDYLVESPFTTRYAYTSNAFPIKKNVNYTMVNLFGPEIHFALTDRFSLGVMTTWIGSPLAFDAKYSFRSKREKLNFSLGGIIGTSGYIYKGNGYGGLSWFTATYGSRLDNVSFSGGYGFIGSLEDKSRFKGGPLFSIAAIKKIGKTTSFIFDSMLSFTQKIETITTETFNGYDQYNYPYYSYTQEVKNITNIAFFLMPGMRFQTTENKAFQVSLAGVINVHGSNTSSFPIPMCSWFYKL